MLPSYRFKFTLTLLMSRLVTAGLGLFALVTILLFYLASSDTFQNLSPQGCRMSWMSPSYILQSNFNTSWSPLATRYSLWLYREVGWESNQVCRLPFAIGVEIDREINVNERDVKAPQ